MKKKKIIIDGLIYEPMNLKRVIKTPELESNMEKFNRYLDIQISICLWIIFIIYFLFIFLLIIDPIKTLNYFLGGNAPMVYI